MGDTFSKKLWELYGRYCWRGEHCALCKALHGKIESVYRDSQGNLCRKHYSLYREDVEAIKAGTAEFPPGFNENAKRVYLVDDDFWMQFRFLEAMVDLKELSEKEAKEQMKVVVEILQTCPTPEERRQREIERQRKQEAQMLPRTRLF